MQCVIGVDVGGTNTDAVLLCGHRVLHKSKQHTTNDVSTGLLNAINSILEQATNDASSISVDQVNIGTTHLVNAVVQRSSGLVRVGVIRLARPPLTTAIPPFCDLPEDLRQLVDGGWVSINGGYEYNGVELSAVVDDELINAVKKFLERGIKNLAIVGVFSPVKNDQEIHIEKVLQQNFPELSFTLSYQLGRIGLVERENAAILNEAVKPLATRAFSRLADAIRSSGLSCPLFLTQNDGTVCSLDDALSFPVLTFSSGPTNSMRGAAFISGIKSGIVVDIGGTSTDVGVIVDGFPREAGNHIVVGGVRTNFRMPDTVSIALGGGTIIKSSTGDNINIGPESVGYRLTQEAVVFGGNTLTAHDIAVTSRDMLMTCDQAKPACVIDSRVRKAAWSRIQTMIAEAIDLVKTSNEQMPVIFVGGGCVLVDPDQPIEGSSQVVFAEHSAVANAIGAALCEVSGHADLVANVDPSNPDSRRVVRQDAMDRAIQAAISNGADPAVVKIVEVDELPLTYMPGNAVQFRAKAVGKLKRNLSSAQPLVKTSATTTADHESLEKSERMRVSENDVTQPSTTVTQTFSEAKEIDHSPHACSHSEYWTITPSDVECITLGSSILGCGGGGNPYLGKLRFLELLKAGRIARIISPTSIECEYGADDVVVPVGFMGAPLPFVEKLNNGVDSMRALNVMLQVLSTQTTEFHANVRTDEKRKVKYLCFDNVSEHVVTAERPIRRIAAVMPFEVGGLNSIEPMALGSLLDVPCLDADFMGRAFPEMQMSTSSIYGHNQCPVVLVSDKGRSRVVIDAPDTKSIEDFAREWCIENGCVLTVALSPIPVSRLRDYCIPRSLSRAWRLGRAVLEARRHKQPTVQEILRLEHGRLLFTGKITDVSRRTDRGFNLGFCTITGLNEHAQQTRTLEFQNEYLVLFDENQVCLASVPDLICMVETETGLAVTTEELRYGLRVSLLGLAPSPRLTTDVALNTVGPHAFGYSTLSYQPCCDALLSSGEVGTNEKW